MNREKVFLVPNGNLIVATPLYMVAEADELEHLNGHIIAIFNKQPTAYVVDMGAPIANIINARWADKNLECLGEL